MELAEARVTGSDGAGSDKTWLYYWLFFLSGFPALIYQIVWQRALFTLYGVNVEAVTMVVTVFMLGLGLGSLAGGWLSARKGIRLLLVFGLIELSVGAFGACSLWVFHRVGVATAGASTMVTGGLAFVLLLVPTLLMGSTLPLLAEHFTRRSKNVGESVGTLYSVNTFGAAVACFIAGLYLMNALGEAGSVRAAAVLNAVVGAAALLLDRVLDTDRDAGPAEPEAVAQGRLPAATSAAMAGQARIPFWVGMVAAGATGFIALAYEIIWYRLYAFTSESRAGCFAKLLAFYLAGIAYGSLAVRDACRRGAGDDRSPGEDTQRTLAACAKVVMLGGIAAFLLGPALAAWGTHVSWDLSYWLVFIAAALLGAAFPLLAHAAIDPARGVGKGLSYLYLSNIVGSTLGSFLVGFVVLNYWSTRATTLLLLTMGVGLALALGMLSGWKGNRMVLAAGCGLCVVLALTSGPLFGGLYEKLLMKAGYTPGMRFKSLVENRSGVIAVDDADTIYGGGAYDGKFSIDLVHDSNMLYRAFAVAGLHARPREVLVIGLSSGSWVQVLANDPGVERITVIEINPGYIPLIEEHASVQSLLHNPKVDVVIDDGRRWLLSHPDRRFDFVLMNTTFHWRAHVSNLLSTEFLALIHTHLNPGGIEYYNTTWSNEAQATGVKAFPYALRVGNFLAVSDSPIELSKERWKAALIHYQIDGRPVFDMSNAEHRKRLNEIVTIADSLDVPGGWLESRASIEKRTAGLRLISDDNMGTEWLGR